MVIKTHASDSNPADHAVFWVKDLQKKHKVDDSAECSNGCDYCCHQIVSLTIYEAVRLARGIEKLTDEERAIAFSRAELNVEVNNNAKSDMGRWKKRLPCSLLHERQCSVYGDRPVACVAITSVSKQSCVDIFNDKASKQHLALAVHIEELETDNLLLYQIRVGENNKYEKIKLSSPEYYKALIIDLDKFVHYYCVPDKKERERRLDNLRRVNGSSEIADRLMKQTEQRS